MDERSLQSLEFGRVLDVLSNYCVNAKAKERARKLRPIDRKEELNELHDELDESTKLFLQNGSYRVGEVDNVIPLVERAVIESTLNFGELLKISALLRVVKDLKNYYISACEENSYPILDPIFLRLSSLDKLENSITSKIIDEETIADNASENLYKIRRDIVKKNEAISHQLNRIINNKKNESALQDRIVSIRQGRYVIPVKESHRSQIPGIIVDRSATGSTLFIEPVAVLELNNSIRELEIKEAKEIERILKALTREVALENISLSENYSTLIDLDFLFAKANYALDENQTRPEFTGEIELKKARHPLIPKEKVVASNIELSPETKTLVITGPNTGGKTVVLKTMGLISAMAQSGLFIPASSNSKMRLFKNIFADIGDEQSIEQNLSTFSSHMTNIVEVLNRADKDSLVLFDELGSGTDPIEGAALAISILEDLKKREILTFATTHYAEIKEYALSEDGVTNASVEFDVKTLKPTYRLLIGLPGKSNAFEIAGRLGLSEEIIENSRKRVSEDVKVLDETIDRVQEELRVAREEREEAERLKSEASESLKEANEKREKSEEKAERIISEASSKAREMVDKTQKETRTIYKEIQKIQRNAGASVDNKTLEALRSDLNKTQERVEKSSPGKKQKRTRRPVVPEKLKKGDRVFVISLGREAEVLNVINRGKKVEVSAGPMRIKVDIGDLEQMENLATKKSKVSISAKRAKMNTRLDLRGKSVAESEELVENFIADALLLGEKKLEIIHGFGTGQVRKAVHDYLKKSKHISSYRLGGPGEGGAGATIVEL